jgi:hypothetical protein
MESAQMSICGRMDEENVVYTHNGILFSYKKDETLTFLATSVELEVIKLNKPTQKGKCRTLIHWCKLIGQSCRRMEWNSSH